MCACMPVDVKVDVGYLPLPLPSLFIEVQDLSVNLELARFS